VSDATSDHMTTGAVMKINITDEKTEQKNAWRRAAYRNKKEDGTVKLRDENQPSLPMTGMII
jgi:hypothetical protein